MNPTTLKLSTIEQIITSTNPNVTLKTILTIFISMAITYFLFKVARRLLGVITTIAILLFISIYIKQLSLSNGQITSPIYTINAFTDTILRLLGGDIIEWKNVAVDMWNVLRYTLPNYLAKFIIK